MLRGKGHKFLWQILTSRQKSKISAENPGSTHPVLRKDDQSSGPEPTRHRSHPFGSVTRCPLLGAAGLISPRASALVSVGERGHYDPVHGGTRLLRPLPRVNAEWLDAVSKAGGGRRDSGLCSFGPAQFLLSPRHSDPATQGEHPERLSCVRARCLTQLILGQVWGQFNEVRTSCVSLVWPFECVGRLKALPAVV